MLRRCSKCGKMLRESEFNWKLKNSRLSYHCKICSRKYVREHYLKHTKYYIDKAHKRNSKIKEMSINFIGNFLSSHRCVDCGESDILVLEFDHKDRLNKLNEISKMFKGRSSLKAIRREISKCEVRCANCHRRKTAKETNSWRLKFSAHSSTG